MGTIRFVLRTDKPLKNGLNKGFAPIDLIYQVHGKKVHYRTDLKLPGFTHIVPDKQKPALLYWDIDNQKALFVDRKQAKKYIPGYDLDFLPTQHDIEDINHTLNELIKSVKNIEKRFVMDNIQYSVEMVVERLKKDKISPTKIEDNANVIFEFMGRYIDENKKTRQTGSLSVYKSVKNHLENFCKATGKKVTFENIDYNFFQSFQNYLLEDKTDETGKVIPGLNNTTVAKQLSTIKTFLNYAKVQGIAVSDKYKDFKIKKETLEVIALTNDEFERLYNLDLSGNKRLAETRDVFCFSCATGLRYSDLAQLKREHIKAGAILLTVKKTKELLTVPLNSYSNAILAKYAGMHKPLPVISNQNMNYNVKELCEFAQINDEIEIVRFKGVKRETNVYKKYELIGVHTGRKTFCTLSLEKGMSTEEVMAVSGHKDYKSFKRYVFVSEQRKKVVMLKAWDGAKEVSKLQAV